MKLPYKKIGIFTTLIFVALVAIPIMMTNCKAAGGIQVPGLKIEVDSGSDMNYSAAVKIFMIMTVLSLAPAIIIMTTSFVRIIIVFHFIRQALGAQQTPPNQLLVGLALFLTFFIMAPVWLQLENQSISPLIQGNINEKEAYQRAQLPLKDFMKRQIREKDLALFVRLANIEKPENFEDVPVHVIIPAFIISELKTAFQIGFVIFIPFVVIDITVASILLSMGMMMLPPVMISIPFKILLFIMVDGWNLLVGSLTKSFF